MSAKAKPPRFAHSNRRRILDLGNVLKPETAEHPYYQTVIQIVDIQVKSRCTLLFDPQSKTAWLRFGYPAPVRTGTDVVSQLDQEMLREIVREELAGLVGQVRAELQAHEDRKAFTGRNPYLTLAQTEELTGLSRKTIWQRRSAGNFVKAHGARNRPMFRRDDLLAWMEDQASR